MKSIIFLLLMGTFFFSSPLSAEQAKDTLIYPACQYCGMDRHKFAHSRMLIEYDDGSTVPTCSIHCTAIDLAQKINATPAAIKVGDYDTKELIAAEGAIWILGDDRKGVMSSRPKWAFSSDAAAAAFVATHGGNIVTFDEAMKASYADMDSDSKSIRRKRQNKKMETMEHSNMTPTHDH